MSHSPVFMIYARRRRVVVSLAIAALLLSAHSLYAQQTGASAKIPSVTPVPFTPNMTFARAATVSGCDTTSCSTNLPPKVGAAPFALLPGYTLVDSLSINKVVPAGKRLRIAIDNATQKFSLAGDSILPADATAAIAASPAWLRPVLADNLRRLNATTRAGCEAAILAAGDNIRDEVAFEAAHLSPVTLSGMDLRILTINAQGIYNVAPDLAYVKLVEHGSPASGDWYTTTSYRYVVSPGDTAWQEIPKEIYYWWVMMPKIDDEDPQMNASVLGQFWRDHLYTNADTGYPVLRNALRGVKVVWDGQTHVWQNQDSAGPFPFSDTMCAIQAIGQWVEHTLPEMAQPPRPIQPNLILHHHYGNCGELQDLVDAGARTALLPVMPTETFPGDHCWTGLYVDSLWNYWDVWRGGGPTLIHNVRASQPNEMDFPQKACISGWRGDGLQIPMNYQYTKTFTLNVNVVDANNKPVDGAEVFIAACGEQEPRSYSYNGGNFFLGTWGHTDANGVFTIQLSDSIWYGLRVDASIGSSSSDMNNFSLLPDSAPAPGATYNVNVQLSGAAPTAPTATLTQPVTAGAYEVVFSGAAAQHTIYGGKLWQNNNFGLDDQDYAESLPGGTMTMFACSPNDYDNYMSGSPFYAFAMQQPFGGSDSGIVLQNSKTGDYIALSGEWLARSSNTLNTTAYLYYNPALAVRQPAGAPSATALAVPALSSTYPIPIDVTIGGADRGYAAVNAYNALGMRVGKICAERLNPGEYHFAWDGAKSAASGVYFIVLNTAHGEIAQKTVITR